LLLHGSFCMHQVDKRLRQLPELLGQIRMCPDETQRSHIVSPSVMLPSLLLICVRRPGFDLWRPWRFQKYAAFRKTWRPRGMSVHCTVRVECGTLLYIRNAVDVMYSTLQARWKFYIQKLNSTFHVFRRTSEAASCSWSPSPLLVSCH